MRLRICSVLYLAAQRLPTLAAYGLHRRYENISSALSIPDNATTRQPAVGNVSTDSFTTGSGLAYASSCNAAKQTWIQQGGMNFASNTTITTVLSTVTVSYGSWYSTTLTSLAPDQTAETPYTLCDGYPRISGTIIPTETQTVGNATLISTVTTVTPVFTTGPQPDCMINPSDCAILSSSWLANTYPYASWTTGLWGNVSLGPSPLPPQCGPVTTTTSTTSSWMTPPWDINPICPDDWIRVRLLYWPVKREPDCGLCATTSCSLQTLTPTISGRPNTIVTLDTTLTSPTNYIQLIGTFDVQSGSVTSLHQVNGIYPQIPESISTICWTTGYKSFMAPINYADLDEPVPASAYRCQASCWPNEKTNICSTIGGGYRPALIMPEAFRNYNISVYDRPDLRCTLDYGAVFYDPPTALVQATTVASFTLPTVLSSLPTDAGSPSGEPAAPVSSPTPSTPAPTAAATTSSTTLSAMLKTVPESRAPLQLTDSTTPSRSAQRTTTGTMSHGIGGMIASILGLVPASPSSESAGADPDLTAYVTGIATVESFASSRSNTIDPDTRTSGVGQITLSSDVITVIVPSTRLVVSETTALLAVSSSATTNAYPYSDAVIMGTETTGVGQSKSVPSVGSFVVQSDGLIATETTLSRAISSSVTAAASSNSHAVGLQSLSIGQTTSLPGVGSVIVQFTGLIISATAAVSFATAQPDSTLLQAGPTIGSSADTMKPTTGAVITIATLTPGGAVTVSGITLSLEATSGTTALIVNGQTETFAAAAATASQFNVSTSAIVPASLPLVLTLGTSLSLATAESAVSINSPTSRFSIAPSTSTAGDDSSVPSTGAGSAIGRGSHRWTDWMIGVTSIASLTFALVL